MKLGDDAIRSLAEGVEGSLLSVESGGTPKAITAIAYDASGNVTSITEGGVTTTYTYDSAGNALTETRFGVTRTFTYSGDVLTGATV